MAQRVQVLLTDDLDGSEATETVQFGLDGRSYEIDLNDRNAKKLRDALAAYVDKARRAGGSSSSRGRRSNSSFDPKAVRVWARENNIDVPERGRIPAAVVEQFRAAGH